jgi:two-component sensor histidine kinase/DNA-binding response OmpR family regulator
MTQKINVLLVDDQPEKLLAYEVILRGLDENLVKAASAREALAFLLKNDVAVVLIDVCMPELDGFQLAALIREHPRFQKTAIIFISAIQLTDVDRLRGYQMGGVDYVPVPVVPDLLRAKVRIFAELFRKTRALEQLNARLERGVAERTAELEASNARLKQSEQGRSLALAAGQMGSWEWEVGCVDVKWDEGQYRIFGVDPGRFHPTIDNIRGLVHAGDWQRLARRVDRMSKNARTQHAEFRVLRPDGEVRWCTGTAAAGLDRAGRVVRVSGVTVDITDRKEAEERQSLLAREVDHRARNALAVIQSIIRLTRANNVEDYVAAIEGRIKALARAHTLLSDSRWNGADLTTLVAEELAPYRSGDRIVMQGPDISLQPSTAQGLALALHELATNAAKHGALSSEQGKVTLTWELQPKFLVLKWVESGGPEIVSPSARSFGLRVIRASIEQQLDGEAAFDWNPSGLRCSFSIPYRNMMKSREFSGAPSFGEVNGTMTLKVTSKPRVLVVEDEALVAMMIQECLAEFGYRIVGPVCTASEAAAKAQDGQFEAAVLDINLGDGAVYPIADTLVARGVPFVFITGYDAESVDARFRKVPVLQKPIEREMLKRMFKASAVS